MKIGFKLYEDFSEEGRETFEKAQLEMALLCEKNGWCMEDGYDEDGKRYLIINPPYIPPEPTVEEVQARIQKQLTNAVQRVLDTKAKELLYDNCLSVCSYIDTGVPKFDAEGKAFRTWRSQVWAKGYAILAEVQEGKRGIPTKEELLAELPELVIEYTE